MPSTIPVFKGAFYDKLLSHKELSDVNVFYGVPHTGTGEAEIIYLGGTRPEDPTRDTRFDGGQSQWLGTGADPKISERYVLDVMVSVGRPWRSEQRETTDRAFELAGVVESCLLAWRFEPVAFDGVVDVAQVRDMYHTEPTSPRANPVDPPAHRFCEVFMSIAVHATI